MALGPGTSLGPFKILSVAGKGGMGIVYRALDTRLNRQVAIKVLAASSASDGVARDRLRREAVAAAAVDHPYICKVFEIGEQDSVVYLVMEYITGESLHQRLHSGALPTAEVVRLCREILEALEEAHARGFVHRDLKPSNILLTPQGHPKVMDFGLAKKLLTPATNSDETAEMSPPLTAPGTLVGTPDYMSPEQIKGQVLDQRSDLFSFGVIAAEMATGRHPFREPTVVETLSAILNKSPVLPDGIPAGLAAIIHRLLAKSPADRYASAAEIAADLAQMDSVATPVPERNRSSRAHRRWPLIASIAALLAIGGFFGVRAVFQPGSIPAGNDVIRSIAVLPLDNFSADPAQDYFAEGMTDELTTELANISKLRVISRGSAMQFQGKQRPSTPDIARILGVDAVVEGSVLRSGEKVRITAQLIDARGDRHLWAQSFERKSSDVLALQDELASAIAREIRVQLSPAEQSRLTRPAAVNPQAYDAYLRGRYFFNRPSDENLQKAIAQFEEAARLSPNFAPAFSGLSDAYLWAGYNEDALTSSEARPKAKAAAEQAASLDPNSAEAHASLATYKLFYEEDWPGCEQEYRRSISLNPNYAFAHDQFVLALSFQGRFDEAIAESKRAAELDPLSPQILMDSIFAFAWSGKVQQAREQVRKAAELDPTFFFPPFGYAWLDMHEGKMASAISWLKKSKAMGAPSFVSAFLGYAYGISGDRERAAAEIEGQRRASRRAYVPAFNLALVNLGLGENTKALDMLEKAYETDSQWLPWLRNDRIFNGLRKEPRFAALLHKLHFD